MVTTTDSTMVMGCRLSNTSRSTPFNSGFIGVHVLKCVYRKEVGLKASQYSSDYNYSLYVNKPFDSMSLEDLPQRT